MGTIVHGGLHRTLRAPSCYGGSKMVCVQASLLVAEQVAAGWLLSSAGFTGARDWEKVAVTLVCPVRPVHQDGVTCGLLPSSMCYTVNPNVEQSEILF